MRWAMFALTLLFGGCDGDASKGTRRCGTGTHLSADGLRCEPTVTSGLCGPGTRLDEASWLCEPDLECRDGTHPNSAGTECVVDDDRQCGFDTALAVDGVRCRPDDEHNWGCAWGAARDAEGLCRPEAIVHRAPGRPIVPEDLGVHPGVLRMSPSGILYIYDFYFDRVARFDLVRDLRLSDVRAIDVASTIEVDQAGDLYIGDIAGRIERIDADTGERELFAVAHFGIGQMIDAGDRLLVVGIGAPQLLLFDKATGGMLDEVMAEDLDLLGSTVVAGDRFFWIHSSATLGLGMGRIDANGLTIDAISYAEPQIRLRAPIHVLPSGDVLISGDGTIIDLSAGAITGMLETEFMDATTFGDSVVLLSSQDGHRIARLTILDTDLQPVETHDHEELALALLRSDLGVFMMTRKSGDLRWRRVNLK